MTPSIRQILSSCLAVISVLSPADSRADENPQIHALQPGLSNLHVLSQARTRSISPENPTGEKGRGAMGIPNPNEKETFQNGRAADDLGQGWKVNPFIRINAGQTKIIMDAEGSGIIQHIWMVEGLNRGLVIRFFWDEEETPSIECPVPDFFAVGHGKFAPVNSATVVVNAKNALNSYWPMPFRKHAKITITNETKEDVKLVTYQITWQETPVPADSGYFHAQFRRASTAVRNPYVILDGVKGKGRYVGTFLAYTQLERGWFGEGEIKFYMDADKEFPTICGTGMEDYFLQSYGLPQVFSTLYSGNLLPANAKTANPPQFWSVYRWHILDPINFQQDLRITLQALGWKNRKYKKMSDDIASVAYWYQTEPHAPFPRLPSVEERLRVATPAADQIRGADAEDLNQGEIVDP